MNPLPRLTVVLPFREDVPINQLAACLHSLNHQTLSPESYEILLAGSDATRLALPSLRCALRVVPANPSCTPAQACNVSIQAATAEIILFLRPDIVAAPDCLRQHLEIHLAAPDAEYGVLGRLDLPPGTTIWRRLMAVCGQFSTSPNLTNAAVCGFEHINLRNLSLPRRSIVAAGLFDEQFCEPEWGLEVQELALRLRQVPVQVVHAQTCIATMQYLPGLKAFIKASLQRGADLARMQVRHPFFKAEPTLSAADLHYWRNLPTRLTARINNLTDLLLPLETQPTDAVAPLLPNPASLRASLAKLSRLRTREILGLLDSLESSLVQNLREDSSLPSVLFLGRFQELIGFFSTDAAASLCPPENSRSSPKTSEITTTSDSTSRRRILLATNYFWPSVGGTELLVEELGQQLMKAGFAVDVACRHLDARTVFSRKSMRIHAFRCGGDVTSPDGPDIEKYRRLICSGEYDAMIILSHPDTWCCSLLRDLPAAGKPRIIMMPSINADNLNVWQAAGELESIYDVLRTANIHITVSEHGIDATVLDKLKLPFCFIPHSVTSEASSLNIRQRLGLPQDVPILACVGNFWPVKNQLELLKVMNKSPGNWKLILAGGAAPWPDKRPYFMACWDIIRDDPRMHHIGPLQPLDAAALIRDADILLLPSKGESAGPLVVLQAMASGTPWIATPECNAVHDEAGGLIVKIEHFPLAATTILHNPDAAQKLADLGQEHWQRCFRWEQSLDGFIDLIEGRLPSMDLRMPEDLRQRWQNVVRSLIPDLSPLTIRLDNECHPS